LKKQEVEEEVVEAEVEAEEVEEVEEEEEEEEEVKEEVEEEVEEEELKSKLFLDESTVINLNEDKNLINSWIDISNINNTEIKTNLIFRASRDDWDAYDFHR
jgi:hypothetical protein